MSMQTDLTRVRNVPSPGGGTFVGPGGQAPSTEPGNPSTVPPVPPIQRQRPTPTTQAQSSMPTQEFLARIVPLEGSGAAPGIPTQLPTNIPPASGGGSTVGKPNGLKTLPMPDKDKYTPPEDPPKPPGQWVTIDGGKGQPPAWGFIARPDDPGADSGLEPAPKKPKSATASYLSSRIKEEEEQKGHYVPVQMPSTKLNTSSGPTWCWIPEIDSDYGVKQEEKEKT